MIINMPSHDGLLRAWAIAIQTIIANTMFTIGMKNSITHQPGLSAILHMRYILAIGIQANHAFCVKVFLAIVYKHSDNQTYTASQNMKPVNPDNIPAIGG